MPSVLAGSQIGTTLLKILPQTVVSIVLTVVLILIGSQVLNKAIEETKKEKSQSKIETSEWIKQIEL